MIQSEEESLYQTLHVVFRAFCPININLCHFQITDTTICHTLQVKHGILCTDLCRLKRITNSMAELHYINANTKSKWGETQITSYLQFFEVHRYLKPISHTMTNTVSRNNEPVRECDFPVCVYSNQYIVFARWFSILFSMCTENVDGHSVH